MLNFKVLFVAHYLSVVVAIACNLFYFFSLPCWDIIVDIYMFCFAIIYSVSRFIKFIFFNIFLLVIFKFKIITSLFRCVVYSTSFATLYSYIYSSSTRTTFELTHTLLHTRTIKSKPIQSKIDVLKLLTVRRQRAHAYRTSKRLCCTRHTE